MEDRARDNDQERFGDSGGRQAGYETKQRVPNHRGHFGDHHEIPLCEWWHVPFSDMGRKLSVPRKQADARLTRGNAVNMISRIKAGHIGRLLKKGVAVQ